MIDDRDRLNILLVDDRPDQLLVLESVLVELDQNLIRAGSGREALRFLLSNDCAVILLDVNMPDLDGFETANLIRRHPRSSQIPIIFFTAGDETDTHLSRGYSLGAVDYLHTPVLPEVLLAKVSVFVDLARRTREVQREAERLEARVRVRTAELERLNAALETEIAERRRTEADRARLLEEAQEGVRRRDEFLAMLAHELRNPLASIVSAAEIMQLKGTLDPDLEPTRQIIERQSAHMSSLLQELLDISRITRGKIELNRAPVDVATIIRDAVDSRWKQSLAASHEIIVELDDEPLYVDGDATRLQQVFVNLLTNAIKFTDPSGRIWIGARREQNRAVVFVRDTGVGIARTQLSRIFEPFVQVSRSHQRSSEGLGIGLTLVQRLAELHGGSVSATSPGIGQGSEFRVNLPLCVPAEEEAERQAPANGTAVHPSTVTARRIVVIEDNQDVCRMLCALLQMNGHEVSVSGDGQTGVDLIRSLQPDTALVDVGLPLLNGYEVATQVRADPACRNVRLIAMTGYGQPEDRRRALSAGFDAHLIKPVRSEQLIELLASPDSGPDLPGCCGKSVG